MLAKNFGVAESAFADIPLDFEHSRYMFAGALPPALEADAVTSPAGAVPLRFSHRLGAQAPIEAPGGRVRIVDSSDFPISRTVAAALVEVEPGAMRELHWHTTTDEWQYYLSGQGRMTVVVGLAGATLHRHPVGIAWYGAAPASGERDYVPTTETTRVTIAAPSVSAARTTSHIVSGEKSWPSVGTRNGRHW